MERYKNLGGDSGVSFYEFGMDHIIVQFKDGSIYLYNDESASHQNIEKMKELAMKGIGLNEFINRHARKKYAKKLK